MKPPKLDRKALLALVDRLEAEQAKVEAAIAAFNSALAEHGKKVDEAVTAYNEVLGELSDLLSTTADDADSYFDEKSERWQESDRGQALVDWAQALRDAPLDDLEVELPSDLEDPDWHTDDLRDLPERPE